MLFLFFAQLTHSQNLYVYSGKNITKYDYKTSNGQASPKLVPGSGNYYEIGCEATLKEKSLSYMGGLSLNQFNSTGGDEINQVAWKTNYLGFANTLGWTFLKNKTGLKVRALLGLNIATIVQGDQIVNNTYIDLTKNDEFKGIVFQTSGGLDFRYNVQEIFDLSLKYSLSKVVNVSNSSAENLTYTNNQVAFGIIFPLNNNNSERRKMQQIIEQHEAAQRELEAQKELVAQQEKSSLEKIAAMEKAAQDRIEVLTKETERKIADREMAAKEAINAREMLAQEKIAKQEKTAQDQIKSQTKKAKKMISAQVKAAQQTIINQNK